MWTNRNCTASFALSWTHEVASLPRAKALIDRLPLLLEPRIELVADDLSLERRDVVIAVSYRRCAGGGAASPRDP